MTSVAPNDDQVMDGATPVDDDCSDTPEDKELEEGEDGNQNTPADGRDTLQQRYNAIFPLKLYRLMHEGSYRHIVDFFSPAETENFGDPNIWNLDQKVWNTIDFNDKPRGGIVFHRPRDFFLELWPLIAAGNVKTKESSSGKSEEKKSLDCFIRQLNIYKFHFCAMKNHPSRQTAFTTTNSPVHYFHYCYEPSCSPVKLHEMMILCKQEEEDKALEIAKEHAKDPTPRPPEKILQELSEAEGLRRSKVRKHRTRVTGRARTRSRTRRAAVQTSIGNTEVTDDVINIISETGALKPPLLTSCGP
eukprot:gb/GECG01004604.1/.p1 GENE.gb/GECG01004604.1/~~gb/GECG01004604.1/.p1  ORF type:complete len:303 (+),score=36.96 gb/GECG01004604.1/:1-909(+)